MQRRTCWFIATLVLSLLAAPLTAREGQAHSAGKVHRVGVVFAGSSPLAPGSFGQTPAQRAFLDRLANHGYVEGQNLVIEPRRGKYDRLAEFAAELVRLQVDVIFTSGTKTSRIVAEAVTTTPIVMFSCDPFEHVARLSRPDGNLTGVTCMTTELSAKRLELLKEAVPKASRVVFLSDPP